MVGTVPTKYYDNIYFDSDSEDEDKAGKMNMFTRFSSYIL